MPEQTDTWRPDAEPWEALNEAEYRAYVNVRPAYKSPEDVTDALDEMGWRLVPGARLRELEAGAEPWVNEAAGFMLRAKEAEARVRELEAENERLRKERAAAPPPVPEGEEGRTPRRLTAVEEAIWGRYHGKHRDAGLLNKVNYLTRRVDALESPAPVPVEEPEQEEIECDRCGVAEVEGKYDLDDVEVTLCGRCAREVGRKTPLYRVAKAEAEPSPAPESYVKHVDAGDGEEQDRHNSAPEIKVGQVWRRKKDGYTARVKEIEGTTVWLVDVAIARGGGVWLRLSQFPDEGSRPFTDDYVRTYFDVVYDPPDRSNPSLDLEGLAKLDAEIADLRKDPMAWRGEPDWAARQVRIDALSMAREWLVKEAENDA